MSSLQPGKISEANFGKSSVATALNRLALCFFLFSFAECGFESRRALEFKVCVSGGCTEDRKKFYLLIVRHDSCSNYLLDARTYMNVGFCYFLRCFACEVKRKWYTRGGMR